MVFFHVLDSLYNHPEFQISAGASFDKLIEKYCGLSSTESALLLREAYDETRGLISNPSNVEDAMMQVTYRPNEEIIDYMPTFHAMMEEYINKNFAKYLNISIKEYLECTPMERHFYVHYITQHLQRLLEQSNREEKNINKQFSKTPSIAIDSDDLLEGL